MVFNGHCHFAYCKFNLIHFVHVLPLMYIPRHPRSHVGVWIWWTVCNTAGSVHFSGWWTADVPLHWWCPISCRWRFLWPWSSIGQGCYLLWVETKILKLHKYHQLCLFNVDGSTISWLSEVNDSYEIFLALCTKYQNELVVKCDIIIFNNIYNLNLKPNCEIETSCWNTIAKCQITITIIENSEVSHCPVLYWPFFPQKPAWRNTFLQVNCF